MASRILKNIIRITILFYSFLVSGDSFSQLKSANVFEISTLELSQQLNAKNQVILDIRKAEDYKKSHIHGAINIPYDYFEMIKNNIHGYMINPRRFKNLMEKYGLKNTDNIIIYGDLAYLASARISWMFSFYGHEKIQVLKGGFQGWHNQKFPLINKGFSLPISNYILQINPNILASKFQVFMATKSEDYIIIDARPSQQFKGKSSFTDRKGHIKNAINIPWYQTLKNRKEQDLYKRTNEVVKYKDIEELEEIFKVIPQDKKIILYCNAGSEAAVLNFALKKLGKTAQIYDGSWLEWSVDTKMPVDKIIN